ncbi:lactococcin 972 family bacteriocin [Streptomyces griseoviridis]
MKSFGKALALAAAGAALSAGVLASPASAQTARPPAELGKVSEWGMKKITVNPSAVTPKTVEEVGGGTWTYGTEITAEGKFCYSYYFHGSEMHKPTAKLGDVSKTATAAAGATSKASLTGSFLNTCTVYWGKS